MGSLSACYVLCEVHSSDPLLFSQRLLRSFLLNEGTGELHVVIGDHGHSQGNGLGLAGYQVHAQGHHNILQVVLDAEQKMISAGNHGHAGSKVPHHDLGCTLHSVLIKVKGKILLDNLLEGGDGNLDGPLNHGADPRSTPELTSQWRA